MIIKPNNNMINTKKTTTIETTWLYELEHESFGFTNINNEPIYIEFYDYMSLKFTPEEFDRLIDGMTAFRDALKDNKKIPEKEFIVSEEDAEAAIAMTYKEDV